MKQVYIFRHGETDWNKERRLQGQVDIPLNRTGVSQAQELANKLTNTKIEAIFSSDLERARQTGNTVATKLCVPVFYDPGLRETAFGPYEGKASQLATDPDFVDWIKFAPAFDDATVEGVEDKRLIKERMLVSIANFVKNNKYNTLAISSHGCAITLFLAKIFPDAGEIWFPNCGFVLLNYFSEEDRWELKSSSFDL